MRDHVIGAGLIAIGLLGGFGAPAAEPAGRQAAEGRLDGVPGASAWLLQGRMAAVAAWPVFQRLYAAAQAAFGLFASRAGRAFSLRLDQIEYGFGLCQVETSVQKRAPCKFARFGGLSTGVKHGL